MDIKNQVRIDVLNDTVYIQKFDEYNFMYTPVTETIKAAYGKAYSGGLQCNFEEGTEEYKKLEDRLCKLAENVIATLKQLSDESEG